MMESDPNIKRGLFLSIECINTLNEGLLLHHASVGCPKPQWSKYLSFLKSRRFSELTKPKYWKGQQVDSIVTMQHVALSKANSEYPKIHTLFSTECSSYFEYRWPTGRPGTAWARESTGRWGSSQHGTPGLPDRAS